MDGYKYERYCAKLLKKKGFYRVEVTKKSGDQGIDILAYRNGERYGIQCKYYARPVGNKAVQEVFAGAKFYNCKKSAVLTNQTFTKSAKELAERVGVELWERNHIPIKRYRFGLSGYVGILACLIALVSLFPIKDFQTGTVPMLQQIELALLFVGGLCNIFHFYKWGIGLFGCLCYLAACLSGVLYGFSTDGIKLSGLIFYASLVLISGIKVWGMKEKKGC